MSPPSRGTGTGRADILDSAMKLVREGGTLSLDSVARAAGLTKPGLMYHFPTKEALMTGLVDHVVDAYERELAGRLPDQENASVEERLAAYVDWAFTTEIDRADFVMFTDPRLCEQLTTQWSERLRAWTEVPPDLPPERRSRLLSARLIADGSWFADASGVFPLQADERQAVWTVARRLLEGES